MKIKKYVAPTIKEALAKVKQDLGADAVILHSKKLPQRSAGEFAGQEIFEVTAAIDELDRPRRVRPQQDPAKFTQPDWKKNDAFNRNPAGKPSRFDSGKNAFKSTFHQAAEPLQERRPPNFPPFLNKLYNHLLNAGIQFELAEALIQQVRIELKHNRLALPEEIVTMLKAKMAELVPCRRIVRSSDQRPYIIALIGPTGVGKTTTLAKMATHPEVYGRDQVAFISSDTYRISAIEQLRTFAQIARIPLEVTYTPTEVSHAIQQHQDKDVILLDTPGRSPNNQQHFAEMDAFLKQAQPDEIHLVINVTTGYEDAANIVDRYNQLRINRLLFTKIDETIAPGNMVNILSRFQKPISLITNGQEVPDDIKVVAPNYLVTLIMKDDPIQ